MKLNCTRVFFAASSSLDTSLTNRYYEAILKTLMPLLPNNNQDNFLMQVSHDKFADLILKEKDSVGVFLGTSGVPQNIELNRVPGIRAALVHTQYIADMCRKVAINLYQHNDANVCLIGSDCIAENLCGFLVQKYLLSGFDFQQRNMIRVNKLKQLEQRYLKQV